MSCTVSALPFMLLGSILVSVIQGTEDIAKAINDSNIKDKMSLHLSDAQMNELFNKEFKTQILDKRTLLKTLTEHGAEDIKIEGNDIFCRCENFYLQFYAHENAPYSLVIAFDKENGVNNLVNDLGSEYTVNAQEISYKKIKERLSLQNLQIDDEEIYDDDTIVLTVNLD